MHKGKKVGQDSIIGSAFLSKVNKVYDVLNTIAPNTFSKRSPKT